MVKEVTLNYILFTEIITQWPFFKFIFPFFLWNILTKIFFKNLNIDLHFPDKWSCRAHKVFKSVCNKLESIVNFNKILENIKINISLWNPTKWKHTDNFIKYLFFQQLFIANILFFGILLSVEEKKKSLSKVNYFLLKNEQEINFKRKITLLYFLWCSAQGTEELFSFHPCPEDLNLRTENFWVL